jgi:hypothetical protein
MQGHPIIYAVITLVLAAGILVCLGLIIFHSLKRYSRHFLKNDDPELLNIVLVGTLLIALSQLFGPLVGSTYPMVFGQEASDYKLSLESVYCDISYNNSTNNYKLTATTDSAGMFYDRKEESNVSIYADDVYFINRIDAINLNPFVKYDSQIFLSVIESNFDTCLTRPVIKVGQSSDLYILLDQPPGTYKIKLRGEGQDGKICDTMMIIRIAIPHMTTARTYTYTYDTGTTYNTSNFTCSTPITENFTGSTYYMTSTGGYTTGYVNCSSCGGSYTYMSNGTGMSGYSGGGTVYSVENRSTSYTPTATYTSTSYTPTATYTSTAK